MTGGQTLHACLLRSFVYSIYEVWWASCFAVKAIENSITAICQQRCYELEALAWTHAYACVLPYAATRLYEIDRLIRLLPYSYLLNYWSMSP